MRQTVIGFFSSSQAAQQALERLRSSGFMEQDIDLSYNHLGSSTGSEKSESYSLGSGNEASYSGDGTVHDTPYNVNDEARETRTSGNMLNEDRIRERERDEEGGMGDSIGRFFRNLFDNKEEAEKYSSVGRRNSIVTVYVDNADEAQRAADILDDCGAVDVDENYSQYGSYTDTTTSSATDVFTDDARNDNTLNTSRDLNSPDFDESRANIRADGVTDNSIPVIEENLQVGKREVETGGVRLRSRIFERPVEESLRLRQEHVRVERTPVNRPATEADFDTFKEGEIEMTETAEVPIVNKEARVVEEVRLNKEVTEREEIVRDTVRNTDVDVENLSEESLKSRKGRSKKI
jgi:stress response protein YsnF